MLYHHFQCLNTLTSHSRGVQALALSPDGRFLVSGGSDATLKFWSLPSGQEQQTWKIHRNIVATIALSPDGKTLASGSRDETAKLVDLQTGEIQHTLRSFGEQGHPQIASVAFSHDSQILFMGTDGGSASYWDVKTGRYLGYLGWMSRMAVSADGKLLVGAYLSDLAIEDLIRVRAKQTLPTKQTISTPRNVISAVAISPDSSLSLSGHHNGEINLWNTHSGQNQGILKGHSDLVGVLAIAPNGKVLASGGRDRTIKLWDLATQTEICTLTDHTGSVKALAFSPDSKLLVSGSLDKTLKIWGAA
ncbi:WD40 repeat domain-containing protein [Baaleninema simplex]|uniref:WD40 repeat domain-containing protein n=1 Tax=Baaleninema simplex TaxID=2862350 RepID=UPI00036EBACC|nr:WD40 repeat domain-containing protein [Baaleninema simplex]